MADAVRLWGWPCGRTYYRRSLWGAIGLLRLELRGMQFTDQVASMDALVPPSGPMMSLAVHVVMLALSCWSRIAVTGPSAILQS
jgi:hypothetical protein